MAFRTHAIDSKDQINMNADDRKADSWLARLSDADLQSGARFHEDRIMASREPEHFHTVSLELLTAELDRRAKAGAAAGR